MALIDEIDGALLAIVDPGQRVVYSWFGGSGVNVYDEDGNEVSYFTIGGSSKVTAATARAAIQRVIQHNAEAD